MKKVILACLLMASASAFAWGHYGYRGGYHGWGWGGWVAPAVVGGVIGYSLATPPVYAAPPVVYTPPPVVVQPGVVTTQPNCSAWTEIRNPDGTVTTQRVCQ